MKKILVLHRSQDACELLVEYLKIMGMNGANKIETYTDGAKAAEAVKSEICDIRLLVTADILPSVSGEEIAKLAKGLAREEGIDVPVLLVTAKDPDIALFKEAHQRFQSIGNGILVEPFSRKAFQDAVREAIAACN